MLALFALLAQRRQREVWRWSTSRGLRVAHNLRLALTDPDGAAAGTDAASTRELPAAPAAMEQLKGDALVLRLVR